jgi:hypothetical protein
MGVIFSIIIACIGALATLYRWRQHRKKNRVDIYYKKTLKIEDKINELNSKEKCNNALEELKTIKHKAFELMIDEKLNANESFNIFLSLVDNLILRIENRIKLY